jgi:ABC-type phosphate/phosphonate transport system substrate-binding protein
MRRVIAGCLVAALVCLSGVSSVRAADPAGPPLSLVVMDPLSKPLACDCVQGYAQRKYEKLGEFLTAKLHRPVQVYWSASLETAVAEQTSGQADIVIGKHSVVLFDAKQLEREFAPVASLTGADGSTTQTGLFVVRAADGAQKVEDLAGYRIFSGPEDCDEKSLAPMQLLKDHSVALPATIETYPACSNAATALVELEAGIKGAAIISSYAGPLLEGCGTIKKGDLRVVGTSDPVPFITAFVRADLPDAERQAVTQALLDVATDAELLIALETADGFVEYREIPAPGQSPAVEPMVSQVSGESKKKD